MDRVQQLKLIRNSKFLDKATVGKLKKFLITRGITQTQIKRCLMETYKKMYEFQEFENNGYRRPKNRIEDKDYVRTVEFVKNFSETVAINILNALCDKTSLTASDNFAKLIDNISAKINRETNTNSIDGSKGDNIQFGTINAIIELLIAAKKGALPTVTNKYVIYPTDRMNPGGEVKRQNDVTRGYENYNTGVCKNKKILALRTYAREFSMKLRDENRRKFNNQNRSTAVVEKQNENPTEIRKQYAANVYSRRYGVRHETRDGKTFEHNFRCDRPPPMKRFDKNTSKENLVINQKNSRSHFNNTRSMGKKTQITQISNQTNKTKASSIQPEKKNNSGFKGVGVTKPLKNNNLQKPEPKTNTQQNKPFIPKPKIKKISEPANRNDKSNMENPTGIKSKPLDKNQNDMKLRNVKPQISDQGNKTKDENAQSKKNIGKSKKGVGETPLKNNEPKNNKLHLNTGKSTNENVKSNRTNGVKTERDRKPQANNQTNGKRVDNLKPGNNLNGNSTDVNKEHNDLKEKSNDAQNTTGVGMSQSKNKPQLTNKPETIKDRKTMENLPRKKHVDGNQTTDFEESDNQKSLSSEDNTKRREELETKSIGTLEGADKWTTKDNTDLDKRENELKTEDSNNQMTSDRRSTADNGTADKTRPFEESDDEFDVISSDSNADPKIAMNSSSDFNRNGDTATVKEAEVAANDGEGTPVRLDDPRTRVADAERTSVSSKTVTITRDGLADTDGRYDDDGRNKRETNEPTMSTNNDGTEQQRGQTENNSNNQLKSSDGRSTADDQIAEKARPFVESDDESDVISRDSNADPKIAMNSSSDFNRNGDRLIVEGAEVAANDGEGTPVRLDDPRTRAAEAECSPVPSKTLTTTLDGLADTDGRYDGDVCNCSGASKLKLTAENCCCKRHPSLRREQKVYRARKKHNGYYDITVFTREEYCRKKKTVGPSSNV